MRLRGAEQEYSLSKANVNPFTAVVSIENDQ